MELPSDCPFDRSEYMRAWRVGNGWAGVRHGDTERNRPGHLAYCGCDKCMAALEVVDPTRSERIRHERAGAEAEKLRREIESAPRRVDVAPAREHLLELVAGGRSLTSVAAASGLDRTTLNRVLRPDVKRVAAATASAVLAVGA